MTVIMHVGRGTACIGHARTITPWRVGISNHCLANARIWRLPDQTVHRVVIVGSLLASEVSLSHLVANLIVGVQLRHTERQGPLDLPVECVIFEARGPTQ